jgi:DNA-binding winged helix-turn-helix (wHTH) protein/tetratricopeptide (TPR) repeat protein
MSSTFPTDRQENNSRGDEGVKRQFIFGDFILRDMTLFYKGKEVSLPPKERAVLVLLLETAGEVVGKETLLECVWGDEIVGEESLTRCIYALRRILKESKGSRYIQTVYGQGYRFSKSVSAIYANSGEPVGCKLAVLPFRLDGCNYDARVAHDSIIQSLSHFRPFGLTVFPAALTRNCLAASEVVALVKDMAPDFYLTGYPIISHGVRMLRVELVRAADHAVLHRENVGLSDDGWLVALQHNLSALLPRHIPTLQWGNGVPQQISLNVALAFLNGKRDLRSFTPQGLKRAASQFRECLALEPAHVPSWCALAESYLALMLFGLVDCDDALKEVSVAVDKALSFEPNNPLALALLAWVTRLQGSSDASGTLLRQAVTLAPRMAEVHFYHALYLLSTGALDQAAQAIDACLSIDRSYTGAIILNAWLKFCCGKVDDAIAQAKRDLQLYADDNSLLKDMVVGMQASRLSASTVAVRLARAECNVWKSCSEHLNRLPLIVCDSTMCSQQLSKQSAQRAVDHENAICA